MLTLPFKLTGVLNISYLKSKYIIDHITFMEHVMVAINHTFYSPTFAVFDFLVFVYLKQFFTGHKAKQGLFE